jgi:ketosteroid isomerase-like protein
MFMTRHDVQKIFKHLETQDVDAFFKYVVDDVHWTVMGSHPLAGVYHTKKDFLAAAKKLHKVLQKKRTMRVTHIYLDKMIAVVEMNLSTIANNGQSFYNVYCWIVTFNKNKKIIQVRAYIDSAAVQRVIDENEQYL